MLRVFNKLDDIDFRQLMDVYSETNQNSGKLIYNDFPENLQILYAEQDFYNYLCMFFEEKSARYFLWSCEGRYVAGLRLERYSDGLILTALETEPNARRCGMATSLLAAVIEHLKSKGSGRLYSHISKSNQASLSTHRKCGFKIISDYAIYLDGTAMSDSYTLLIEY